MRGKTDGKPVKVTYHRLQATGVPEDTRCELSQ